MKLRVFGVVRVLSSRSGKGILPRGCDEICASSHVGDESGFEANHRETTPVMFAHFVAARVGRTVYAVLVLGSRLVGRRSPFSVSNRRPSGEGRFFLASSNHGLGGACGALSSWVEVKGYEVGK